MQEEIFGPILPLIKYADFEEVATKISQKPKPLALYYFSKSRKNTKRAINEISAGGVCVNESVLHFTNHDLPFGGVNNSGIGKAHGFYGFQEFSNSRSILKQHIFGASQLLYPPYNNLKQKLADITLRWF